MVRLSSLSPLFPSSIEEEWAGDVGFRLGARGTHTSRTMMLAELSAAMDAADVRATRTDYADAVVQGNCLGKATVATRRLTNQRLGELYGLDPSIRIFRALRGLWSQPGRPLLALLCACARDPLLAATAAPIIGLPIGAEFQRDSVRRALLEAIGDRLNEATLEKVVRNAASSWSQSGHLTGRTFKRRQRVQATPASIAYGLYLAHLAGFRGAQLFESPWMAILDCTPARARELAIEAKQHGLIDLRTAGDVVDISFDRLERRG